MSGLEPLFTPFSGGNLDVPNRIVMAPMTRWFSPGEVPGPNVAAYYRRRAEHGVGLIVTEGTTIDHPVSSHSERIPAFHGAALDGWRRVVDEVHAAGGRIVPQIWHVGAMRHPKQDLPNRDLAAMSPSGLHKPGAAALGREMSAQDIADVVDAFGKAAYDARRLGFDGVEIHGANGYLLEQFLQTRTNQRTDQYGGSIANRARLLLEVTEAVSRAWHPDRVGIRLSPYGVANDSGEAEPMPLYSHVVNALDTMGLAYLHLLEPRASGAGGREVDHQGVPSAAELFRPMWRGVLITAGNFRADTAAETVARGTADAIAFGRFFISNPDLPERIRKGVAFTPYNRATFYGGGPEGYVDYPTMEEA